MQAPILSLPPPNPTSRSSSSSSSSSFLKKLKRLPKRPYPTTPKIIPADQILTTALQTARHITKLKQKPSTPPSTTLPSVATPVSSTSTCQSNAACEQLSQWHDEAQLDFSISHNILFPMSLPPPSSPLSSPTINP